MSWTALARKEFKEHVRPAGKWSGTVIAAVVMAVVFGVGATVAAGFGLSEILGVDGANLHLAIFFAMLAGLAGAGFSASLVPMNLGVDAIAGERERHTLQTLLAGPLSDKQILWAKATAILAVSFVTSLVGAAAVWLTLIVLYAQFGLFWGLLALPIGALAPLLPSFAFTCFAFLFATRAKTVKDAGQKMGYLMAPMFMLPGLSVSIGPSSPTAMIVVVSLGAMLGIALFVVIPILAFVGFRRERLLV